MSDEEDLLSSSARRRKASTETTKHDRMQLLQDEEGRGVMESSAPPAVVMERRYLCLVIPLVLGCCVYIATRSSSTLSAKPSLIKAFVCFRHGSRAPSWSYANDMHRTNKELWPEGLHELTKVGKMESYELGKRLRERYGDFLGSYFKPSEVKAFSTLMGRTLMSGQLVLASLFPPTGYQEWNEQLSWQPVPLYPEYIFNKSVGAGCPRFSNEARQNLHNEVKKLSPQSRETIKLVMEHAGEPKAMPWEIFARVWDTVYFQDKANLPVPEWLKTVYPERMSSTALSLLLAFLSGSDVMRQLVLHNYADGIRNFLLANDNKKMEIHSWHDLNNMAMLKTLGLEVETYPEPTSSIIIEMHNRSGHQFFEVYYYDSYKSAEPRQLEMPCGISCSAQDLEDIAVKYKVDNYTELCLKGGPPSKFDKFLQQTLL